MGFALPQPLTETLGTLRWLLQQDGVAAIPKATREPNLRANADSFGFSLDDGDQRELAALART